MTQEEAAEVLRDAIKNPIKYGLTGCTLCGGHPNFVSLFVPTKPFAKRIGQPKGKERVVVYALCEPCSKLPDYVDRVEAAMVKDLGVQ